MSNPTDDYPSLYSLSGLIEQRRNAVRFGWDVRQIETEIAAVTQYESMAARLRHPSAPRDVINEARNIIDASYRPFDQDVD